MAKTLQYWGTGNFQEHPYTGRIVTWTEKEKQTVDDAIATKLLASGAGFVLDNDETGEVVTSRIDPVTGGSVFSVGGNTYSAQIGLLPSNDITGVTDRQNIALAIAAAAAAIAIRFNTVLSGAIEHTDAMLRARTNTDYAMSVTGCTNVALRNNRSNYTRATNIFYVAGTGCVAYDNIGPAGTSVQYASGGAAASDASMQRAA